MTLTRRIAIIFLIFVFANCVSPVDPTIAQAIQRIEIGSSPNPVGSGARALGMGGAFIAVADDATAASWNPAGLIQLETPEISAVGAYFHRTEDNTFGTNSEASGDQSVSEANVNYLSFAYPFTVFKLNMVVSLNYQNLYDFNRKWNLSLADSSTSGKFDYSQSGGLSAYGLAYSVEVIPDLSFGLTLNLWEDGLYKNQWEQTTHFQGTHTVYGKQLPFEYNSNDKYSLSGFNVNLGVLWNATSRLTLGVVFKTPFTADLKHESMESWSMQSEGNTYSEGPKLSVEDETLDMPMSYGLGLAYRFSDQFTMSVDIYRTEWGDFVLKDAKGNRTSPITGTPESESDIEPTHQVRVGGEYLFINQQYAIPLRGGLFYDPAPAQGGPDSYFGLSLGSGIAYGRYVFDIAYQYRFGNNVGKSMVQAYDFSQDVQEHSVYSSLIIHF